MSTFFIDIKFAIRQLLKNPGFTVFAVLALALGIGATTAIVSVVKTAVLDPLPARHPQRFLQFGYTPRAGEAWRSGVHAPALPGLREQTDLFAHVVAYESDGLTLEHEAFPKYVPGLRVSEKFFGLWNLRPLLGRTFALDEHRPGKDDVIVISHRLWRGQFGGDPAIIGQTVPFRQGPMTVVGVMPPHFSFPRAYYEYWRPVEYSRAVYEGRGPNTHIIAEMRPGVDLEQVQAFLEVFSKRQAQEIGLSSLSYEARDLRDMFSKPDVRHALGLLLGGIAFVLLIAAADVANLQLARTEMRRSELALRTALGANRARVFRQLLTENLLLALLGGAAGLVVTAVGLKCLPMLIPPELPRLKPIALDIGVLGVSSGVTLATGLLFGLVPAFQGRRSDLSEVLKLSAATSTGDRRRGWFSRTLITGQVALTLVLLAGAGLMVRSVIGLLRLDPGFDPQNIVHVIAGSLRAGTDNSLAAQFSGYADAQQRIAAIPGVMAAGYSFKSHQETAFSTTPDAPPAQMKIDWIGVDEANPLRVLRLPLLQGRWLNRADMGSGVPSVLVNQAAARTLWPGAASVVGKRLWQHHDTRDAYVAWLRQSGFDTTMMGRPYEVVGVVADTVEYGGIEKVVARYTEVSQPIIYRPLENVSAVVYAESGLFVRTAVPPVILHKPIARALNAIRGPTGMPFFINLQEVLRAGRAGHRTLMIYLCLFAGVGLLLAAIGLYGVLAYSVTRRTREMGIRMALGARITDVTGLVLRQGLALVAVGGVIGITVALAMGRVLRAYLFGVSSTDPMTLVAVALLLAAVALLACWLPARTAARVNPMEALRCE